MNEWAEINQRREELRDGVERAVEAIARLLSVTRDVQRACGDALGRTAAARGETEGEEESCE